MELIMSVVSKIIFGICCGFLIAMVISGIRNPRKFREGFGFIVLAAGATFMVGVVAFGMFL